MVGGPFITLTRSASMSAIASRASNSAIGTMVAPRSRLATRPALLRRRGRTAGDEIPVALLKPGDITPGLVHPHTLAVGQLHALGWPSCRSEDDVGDVVRGDVVRHNSRFSGVTRFARSSRARHETPSRARRRTDRPGGSPSRDGRSRAGGGEHGEVVVARSRFHQQYPRAGLLQEVAGLRPLETGCSPDHDAPTE